jgi:hypothetical protein
MTDLRTAAQQALEALEAIDEDPHGTHSFPALSNDAITALKAALAQQEQEPYCYVYEYDSAFGLHREFYPGPYNGKQKPDRTVPVYTHPPRREWRSLSEEEKHGLYRRAGLEAYYPRDGVVQYEYERRLDAYARAIEAALKERNNG